MPIAAIAVAAIADVSVAGTIGAVVAGTASLASTLAVVGAVGATVGAIGAVTGDKTLSTVGLVLGGVGAIGGLAAGAGLFDSADIAQTGAEDATANAATNAAAMTPTDADITSAVDAQGFPALPGADASADATNTFSTIAGDPTAAVAPADAVTGAAPGAAPELDAALPNNIESANASPTTGLTNDSGAPEDGGTGAGTTDNTALPPGQAASQASTLGTGANPGSLNGLPTNPTVGQVSTPTPGGQSYQFGPSGWMPVATPSSGISGMLSSLTKGDNLGLLTMGGVQTLGSLISGATNPMTPAQITALQAQAAQNQAAANLQTQQNVNMGQPIPTATRTAVPNVTGAPAGIINAPGTTGAITGATA